MYKYTSFHQAVVSTFEVELHPPGSGCQRIYTWGHFWLLHHWGPMVDFAKSSSISFLPDFTYAKSTFFIHSTNFDLLAPSKISIFVNKWLFKLLCVIAVTAFRSSFWIAWFGCRLSPSAHIIIFRSLVMGAGGICRLKGLLPLFLGR